ncbi:hypothetical protein HK105_207646 [Polyrhizophydium stewartii]|uniref:Uncharacterized protein n=1 Tax=Polyrhizophydium stewartii TaxID=2732419 RepID=A0ABR4N041_9FUNG|nr:hypothetical protein HK105_004010 [Polyrhizophydium stewartii]
MSTIKDKAVETAQAVAAKVDPYVPQVAKDATSFAVGTATSAVNFATSTASSAYNFATGTATSAYNYATGTVKVVVNGATTTITAYTPSPILNAVTSTIEGAKALRQDPVGTVKPYVPTFVIHAGEKTYEIVHTAGEKTYDVAKGTQERIAQTTSAATGFIVTKVNGTVQYVTSVPAIGALVDRINRLTTPILTRLGVKKADTGVIEAEGVVEEVDAKEN